jgi:hypothetical protein
MAIFITLDIMGKKIKVEKPTIKVAKIGLGRCFFYGGRDVGR